MGRGAMNLSWGGPTVRGRAGRALVAVAILVLAGAGGVFAQPAGDTQRKEIEAPQQTPAPPGDVLVPVQGAPTLGQASARLTMVEFSDYQCPFCRRYSTQVLPELVKEYVKTGKVRYVFRDFPIASLHPQAPRLHEAAHCAGEQGRYWEMHDRIFEDPQRTDARDLVTGARALGLDGPRFERCLLGGVHAARVRQGIADGDNARVRGTPTFFLAFTEPGGAPVRPHNLVVGAQPYEAFKQLIDGLLAEKP